MSDNPGGMATGQDPHVWIRFESDPFGGSFVCGDEDGEFTRASSWSMLAPYVEELVLVSGNLRDGGLEEALRSKPAGTERPEAAHKQESGPGGSP